MKIRKSLKSISIFLAFNMVVEMCFPIAAYALTGGPSQPEVQSFEPVGTTEMVDVFSGDFVYNIPLMDVEGFPINMSYHSGIGMDDEASWVGLGWNINMGSISRNLRGMPDDLNGDVVKRETNILENRTYGLTFDYNWETVGKNKKKRKAESDSIGTDFTKVGKFSIGLQLGVFYNNYRGMGYEFSVTPSFGAANKMLGGGIGFKANTQSGLDIDPKINLTFKNEEEAKYKNRGFSFGARYNSVEGITDLTMGMSRGNDPVKGKQVKQKAKWMSKGGNQNSSSISIGHSIFNPSLQNSYTYQSFNLSAKGGTEIYGLSQTYGVNGYYTGQNMHNNSETFNGYGYMYSQNAGKNEKVLYDFSRSNDGPVSKDKNVLPITNFTYDLFNIAGEGTGGMFRPHRGDVGVISDPEVKSNIVGLGAGVEFGAANLIKFGIDATGNYGFSRSGKWYENDRHDDLDFHYFVGFQNPQGDPFYEHSYFKSAGEKNVIDEDYYNALLGDKPIYPQLTKRGGKYIPTNQINHKDNKEDQPNFKAFSKGVKREKRDKRNQAITYLTGREAKAMALDKGYRSYELNYFKVDATTRQANYESEAPPMPSYAEEINRTEDDKLSEVTVVNPDGGRYVYGIPAVNHTQVDAVFNVGEVATTNRSKGLVTYNSGDNSLGNAQGEDHFYNKNTLPSYAHSFLLTGVLSQDYVDVRGDGITKDDLGTAVKINYTRTYDQYKWRTPHGGSNQRQANYNEGFKSDIYDDKGQYVYGEKEIWYVHSVESKNFIACFYISKRKDATSVNGENGGNDQASSFYKLDSIRLFTKQELIEHASNPTPIKTAHFEYDYTLCKGIENITSDNSEGGKLTLKKVYFTYGRSQKGKISPYQFTYYYGDEAFNPRYSMQGYDRWGNYKPNASSSDIADLTNTGKPLSNGDDPYVRQSKDSADKYAASWHLTRIKIPSGGYIDVNYESDDYAYIQNKTAGQMFKVLGTNKSIAYDGSNNLDVKDVLYEGKYDDFTYTFFDLNKPVSKSIPSDSLNKIKELYFQMGSDAVYYKFLTDLTNDGDYEFVNGYAEIEESGFISKVSGSSNYDVGYIKFKQVSRNDKEDQENLQVHPIAKSAWYYLKSQLPKKNAKLSNGGEEYKPGGSGGVGDVIKALAGTFAEIKNIWAGESRIMRNKEAGRKIVKNKCFIRLNNPYKMKYGGGSRVKSVAINDNWANMTPSGENAAYGQEYDYTTEIQLGKGTMKISSGVATYEPMTGNDENPFKQPLYFTKKKALAADDRYYIEEPVGEQFMPPPSVGYSKVTVKNIKPSNNINRTATGKTEHEFYTAKDFPVITDRTIWQFEAPEPGKLLGAAFKLYQRTRAFASQGHLVALNDMHGKPKSQAYYREGATVPYSKVSYQYKQRLHPYYGVNTLVNEVDVLNEDGTISQNIVGKNIDVVFDSRQSENYNFSFAGTGNIDCFFAAILPVTIPTWWPDVSVVDNEMGTEVATKVIYSFGLLDKTIVEEEGAQIVTENILYDAQTGDVLLTKTQNEFGDPIYNFTYPAHFAYTGMEQAGKNVGAYFKGINIYGGTIDLKNPDELFEFGDECYLEYDSAGHIEILPDRIWYIKTNHATSPRSIFVTRSGHPVHAIVVSPDKNVRLNLKVIRSGKRNMQSSPIGAFTSLANPVKMGSFQPDSIINTSAAEYNDQWKIYYNYVPERTINYVKNYYEDGFYPDLGTGVTGNSQDRYEKPYAGFCVPDRRRCNQETFNKLLAKITKFKMANPSVTEINLKTDSYFSPEFADVAAENDGCSDCWVFNNDNFMVKDTPIHRNNIPLNIPKFLQYNGPEIQLNENPFKKDFSFDDNQMAYFQDHSSKGPNPSFDIQYSENKKAVTGCIYDTTYSVVANCMVMEMIVQQSVLSPCSTCMMDISKNVETIEYRGKLSRTDCVRGLFGEPVPVQYNFYCICPGTSYFEELKCCTNSDGGSDKPPKWWLDTSGGKTPICDTCTPPENADNWNCFVPFHDSVVNPYVVGLKGNWRPNKNWTFYNKRKQPATTNTRKDGLMDNYSSFWKTPSTTSKWTADSSSWTWTEVSRKISKGGEEVENQNVLGIYNSALYGYNTSLATAVAYNSKHRQLAFDGFEDYDYFSDTITDHFSFYKNYQADPSLISGTISHSGLKSIALGANDSAFVKKPLIYPESAPYFYDYQYLAAYFPKPTEYMESFTPDTGKYFISGWIKETVSSPVNTYGQNRVKVILKDTFKVGGHSITYNFSPSGPVIEGWQRFEGTFTVPDTIQCGYDFYLSLKAGSNTTYFDDIRIFPAKARMKSYVYHPLTLRLMAELDENNYATFYEYDPEGRLIRIKRETERGVVTVQESRTGLKKVD